MNANPVRGAAITLFAASREAGEASVSLLSSPVLSDENGKFDISEHYVCPSASAQVYLVAEDPAPASESGSSGSGVTLMAALGACSDVGRHTNVPVDELTTVASVYALAPFMTSSTSVSAGNGEGQSAEDAFSMAAALSGVLEEVSTRPSSAGDEPEPIKKLITLADVVSVCSSANGGAAKGSPCESLISYAQAPNSGAAKNTVDALLSVFTHPGRNVVPIYALSPANASYKPSLQAAPADWSLSAAAGVPAPVFTPGSGTYTGPQAIALTDSASGALIFYNAGGNWTEYTGVSTVPFSVTVQAIAIASNGISGVTTATYTINQPAITVAASGSVGVGQTGSATISLGAAAPAGGTVVKLASSAAGIATVSPESLTVAQGQKSGTFQYQGIAAGSAMLSAAASGYISGSAQVVISAPVSVAITPATVSLAASQSQQFTAAVANTSNTAVTWTVSPAVGTLSSSGLYTAPASIASTQNVTIVATSSANPAKSASATVALVPTVPVTLSLTPISASVSTSKTQQFTATVGGTTNTAVAWTLTGSGCTGTACGTISSTGLYTAPTAAPSPATVMVNATSQASTSVSATATVTLTTPVTSTGATYYLSATGNDSNNGLSSGSPWLSPNHPLNCGDVILAAPGTNYSAANFYTGKWGTVTCAAGNNVAWLKCATFDSCKISTSANQGMWVDKSYWGVQGWEITTAASDTYGTCFIAQPNWGTPQTIHHIIFANNVANGCAQSGFASTPNIPSLKGVDYLVIVGNVAYNAAQGSGTCASGISVWEPVQSDSVAGTHIYVAGNFSYANLDPSTCNGTSPTDGEGIIFDTFDGSQTTGLSPYTAQAVATNNILVGNGGKGLEVYNNQAGSSHASIYLTQNTTWGDLTDHNQSWLGCGELSITAASNVQAYGNIFSTDSATGCGGHPIYSMAISGGASSDMVTSNVAYGYSSSTTFVYDSGSFTFSQSNVLGGPPSFSKAAMPAAPSCGASANVPACMASMIANFSPLAATAQSMGYHVPSSTPISDPLFPKWLCSVTLPSGLVTMGCAE